MHTILSSAASVRRTRLRGARRARGFTLADLLILVVIVALAAAVLAPALVHASLTPNSLVCQAMLRAVGLAQMAYADDNNDCMSPVQAAYGSPGLPGSPRITNAMWLHLLSEYGGYGKPQGQYDYGSWDDVFHGCPDWSGRQSTPSMLYYPGYGQVYMFHGDIGKGTFGNAEQSGWWDQPTFNRYELYSSYAHGFRRRSEFALPAQRGWNGDSTNWHIGGSANQVYDPANGLWPNWADGGVSAPNWAFGKDPERHGDSSNVLFLDAHVESLHYSVSGHAFGDITKLLYTGDFNGDGRVTHGDYTVWADSYGWSGGSHPADGNHDNAVTQADYTLWADHFGEQRTVDIGMSQPCAPATLEQPSAPAGNELPALQPGAEPLDAPGALAANGSERVSVVSSANASAAQHRLDARAKARARVEARAIARAARRANRQAP